MKIHSKKHMKLFSALIIGSVSLFALSGCNSEARYSEHLEWDGTLTQEEPKVEESVTIKFSLTYNGAAQDASSWATLYAEGSWSLKDGSEDWEDPVALDWNISSQTYDLTLENVAHGDYECQLLFGYNHLETYDWAYRVTTENLSVTIDSSEVTVPVTLDKEVTSIIPEYKAELSGYTLSFTFKYSGTIETVPTWGKIYIAGSWDNPTGEGESWNTFHELIYSSGAYIYTFESLPVGYYKYSIVLDYADSSEISWDHEIAKDQYFEITGFEDSYTLSQEITLTDSFTNIIPEPISNYTLTISISYSNTTEYIPEYVDLYISGDFNDWSQNDKITTYSEGRQSFTYTIETVHVGTEYKYQIIAVREGETFSWSNSLTPSSDQTFTPVTGETGKTITYEATTSINDLVPDLTEADTYTVVVSLLDYSGNNPLVSTGDNYCVYLNSNITTTGDDWDTHKMTYDSETATYRYTYESIPDSGTYNIVLYGGSSTETDWTKNIGSTSVTVGSGLTGSQESETISIHTPYDSLDGYMTSSSYTITIGNLGAAPSGIHVYAAGDFNGWWDGSSTGWFTWGDPVELTSSGSDYILSLDFTPSVSSSFEILCYDSNIQDDSMWDHVLSSELTFSSATITASTTYTDWNSSSTGVYPPSSGGGSGSGGTGGESGGGSSETDSGYYYFLFNATSSGYSNFNSLVKVASGSQLFNGSTECNVTSGATSAGQSYMYNSVVSSKPTSSTWDETTSSNFYGDYITFYDGGSWNSKIEFGSLWNVPEDEGGLYICVGVATSSGYSQANVFPSGISNSNGWVTGFTSVSAFIAACTSAIGAQWS